MSINPLNDISKVYLEQVASVDESAIGNRARSAVADDRLSSEQEKTDASMEKLRSQTKRHKRSTSLARAQARIAAKKSEDTARAMHPKPGVSGYRIEETGIDEVKKEKPKRWWDDDDDGIGYEKGEVSGKFKRKKVKEGFSNWRQDLSEVVGEYDKDNKKVSEKKVNNNIKTSAMGGGLKLGEAVEEIGGTLLEMVEIKNLEGVLDQLTESEIFLLSDDLIEEVVEEFFNDCIEEGYDVEYVENTLLESLEISSALLNEAKVTLGHDTKIKSDRLEKVKSAVKKVGKAAARGTGYAVGLAKRAGSAAKREFRAGYERGRGGSSSSSSGSQSTSTSSSSSDSSDKPKRSGLLSRIGSKLKSGLKKAVAAGARSVSRGARNVARKMEGGETKKAEAPKATPKPKAEKPADPWGEPTTPPKQKAKATTKKAAAPKPKAKTPSKKKKSSNLDNLLASIRNEEVQIDEKTLTKMEMKKREEIVKSMKDKAADFEGRYPGRGKEVMYATATKMAKKMVEQMDEPMNPAQDKQSEMQKKNIQMQKVKELTTRLRAARKGVY